ncbi:MAG: hypothetical protein CMJ90_04975 [Planctomycetes bacterium]|nr:hypothetical protein [Planctomycetota bacterium]
MSREDRGYFEEDVAPAPYVAMQRVAVRMLFDPAFVAAVYEDPKGALSGIDVPEGLVTQLVGNDRRLWGADHLRRSRALKVLLEEFKVSSTLALSLSRRLATLDGFFGSPHFHGAVQRRGYMALGFAEYLADDLAGRGEVAAHARAVLALEAAMARSRRMAREAARGRDPSTRAASEARGDRVVVAPGRVAVQVPGGTVATVQHVERWLFEASLVPALGLCEDAPRPEPLPPLAEDAECWLLEPADGGNVDVAALGTEWLPLVAACERPRTRADLDAVVGAGAWERAASLLSAGVLRRW